jgi:hypothetical protein
MKTTIHTRPNAHRDFHGFCHRWLGRSAPHPREQSYHGMTAPPSPVAFGSTRIDSGAFGDVSAIMDLTGGLIVLREDPSPMRQTAGRSVLRKVNH